MPTVPRGGPSDQDERISASKALWGEYPLCLNQTGPLEASIQSNILHKTASQLSSDQINYSAERCRSDWRQLVQILKSKGLTVEAAARDALKEFSSRLELYFGKYGVLFSSDVDMFVIPV